MINLEIPNKIKPLRDTAYMAAKSIFRPISRKYDKAEHTYPKELDLFASAMNGMNDGSGGAIGGATRVDDGEMAANRNGANMANCVNIQSISYGDVGLLLAIPRQGLGNAAIDAVANAEQKVRFGKLWAAMAITEPNAGSDSAAITTTATKEGEHYVLNGEKIYITSGERADAIVVWATLDKNLGRTAIKSFVVEKGTPGMDLIRVEKKMGIKASDTAAYSFVNCKVPAANLLGDPEINVEKGFAGVMETFDNTRPYVASMALGCAEAAIEEIKTILKDHLNLDYQTPTALLKQYEADVVEMEAEFEAARLLVLRASWMADNKKPNVMEASICKAKAGRSCNAITLKCVALASALGYSETTLLEKWARDSKILDIFEGTQQIQQLIIARRLLNKTSKDLK